MLAGLSAWRFFYPRRLCSGGREMLFADAHREARKSVGGDVYAMPLGSVSRPNVISTCTHTQKGHCHLSADYNKRRLSWTKTCLTTTNPKFWTKRGNL
jgi:hypothetical protein